MKEIAEQFGIKSERARQLLRYYFGLKGTPPAAQKRKRAATAKRHADELATAQRVQGELIAGWRTGQRPQDLAGWFDVSTTSIEKVISAAATDADRKARARAIANQRRRGGRLPTP